MMRYRLRPLNPRPVDTVEPLALWLAGEFVADRLQLQLASPKLILDRLTFQLSSAGFFLRGAIAAVGCTAGDDFMALMA